MVTLISILSGILVLCEFALLKYCRVKKRYLFAFGFFATILVLTALLVTGDITIAYESMG